MVQFVSSPVGLQDLKSLQPLIFALRIVENKKVLKFPKDTTALHAIFNQWYR